LQERLAAARLIDEGILPDMEFSDLHGKTHRLSSYRGKRIVISAWSPT
jgi:peroxiredoxin